MSNESLTDLPAWRALAAHQKTMDGIHMRKLFAEDPRRFETLHATCETAEGRLLLDFSRHRITSETMDLLTALAAARGVAAARDALFAGEIVNQSERRAALHTALRGMDADILLDGESVNDFVYGLQARMQGLSEAIRADRRWTDVVNIGIGGSDLGPRLVCDALAGLADGPRAHFLANIDGAAFDTLTRALRPENTLFIVSSKTFTTVETMMNAQAAKAWLHAGGVPDIADHFVAVTGNAQAAQDFGIAPGSILPMRDWIGGRYSLWSGIGLIIAISIGFENFQALLRGAKAMDDHFRTAPPVRNIPVIMALLGVWCRNAWDMRAHAVLPYAEALRRLPVYIQQLDMESNGKTVDAQGRQLDYPTGPVVFGEVGTNAQHAFFQHLHQGHDVTPADFIVFAEPGTAHPEHHRQLLAHALAQAQALMAGRDSPDAPHRHFPGNRPSSILVMDRLDPFHLGMLLALYEHKVFVQGALWGLNSFDQWGVDLGKTLAKGIAAALENGKPSADADCATRALIERLKKR